MNKLMSMRAYDIEIIIWSLNVKDFNILSSAHLNNLEEYD